MEHMIFIGDKPWRTHGYLVIPVMMLDDFQASLTEEEAGRLNVMPWEQFEETQNYKNMLNFMTNIPVHKDWLAAPKWTVGEIARTIKVMLDHNNMVPECMWRLMGQKLTTHEWKTDDFTMAAIVNDLQHKLYEYVVEHMFETQDGQDILKRMPAVSARLAQLIVTKQYKMHMNQLEQLKIHQVAHTTTRAVSSKDVSSTACSSTASSATDEQSRKK
jgi:hypothetical protein